MTALRGDTHRQFGRFSWLLALKGFLARPTYRVVLTLRLCQAANRLGAPWRWVLLPLAKVLHRWAGMVTGIELPWQTEVAPGLAITHGFGIVVNVNARIGRNVTLFHGATLGQLDRLDRDGTRTTLFPVLEDDVWIGPHAVIVGATVGSGSRIAAGAVVTEDIPPNCLVIGNPAQIARRDSTPDVVNRF